MSFFARALALVFFCGIGLVSALAAANPQSQQLSNLVGSWTCTYKGPGGTRTMTAAVTRLDEDWLQLKAGTGGGALITYDSKRRSWVQFIRGLEGNYALLTAEGSPDATTLHWKIVYPESRAAETSTFSWPTASKRIITSKYMSNGKLLTSTALCTKK